MMAVVPEFCGDEDLVTLYAGFLDALGAPLEINESQSQGNREFLL
jgi:hypothetical protein